MFQKVSEDERIRNERVDLSVFDSLFSGIRTAKDRIGDHWFFWNFRQKKKKGLIFDITEERDDLTIPVNHIDLSIFP